MPYVLTQPGSDKFYSLYGWTQNQKAALTWRSKAEAETYRDRERMTGALVQFVPAPLPPGVKDGTKEIFGYERPPVVG